MSSDGQKEDIENTQVKSFISEENTAQAVTEENDKVVETIIENGSKLSNDDDKESCTGTQDRVVNESEGGAESTATNNITDSNPQAHPQTIEPVNVEKIEQLKKERDRLMKELEALTTKVSNRFLVNTFVGDNNNCRFLYFCLTGNCESRNH